MARLTDEQLANEVKEYVDNFVTQRFPDPLPPNIMLQMKEIIFDAFNDGMHFAEEQHVGEKKSRIVLVK